MLLGNSDLHQCMFANSVAMTYTKSHWLFVNVVFHGIMWSVLDWSRPKVKALVL